MLPAFPVTLHVIVVVPRYTRHQWHALLEQWDCQEPWLGHSIQSTDPLRWSRGGGVRNGRGNKVKAAQQVTRRWSPGTKTDKVHIQIHVVMSGAKPPSEISKKGLEMRPRLFETSFAPSGLHKGPEEFNDLQIKVLHKEVGPNQNERMDFWADATLDGGHTAPIQRGRWFEEVAQRA